MSEHQLSSPFRNARGAVGAKGVPGLYNKMEPPFDEPQDAGIDTIPVVIKDTTLAGHKPASIVSSPMTDSKKE